MNKINTTPEFQIKLLTLGETGVGKTSIILRYTDIFRWSFHRAKKNITLLFLKIY